MQDDPPEGNPESKYVYSTKRNEQEIEAVKESLKGTKYDNPVPLVSTEGEKKQKSFWQLVEGTDTIAPCPSCSKEITADSPVCPHCGRQFQKNMLMWAALGVIMLPVLYWLIDYINH